MAAVRNILRQRRRLHGKATAELKESKLHFRSWMENGREDPSSGLVAVVRHVVQPFTWCMLFPVFWAIVEGLLPEPVQDVVPCFKCVWLLAFFQAKHNLLG